MHYPEFEGIETMYPEEKSIYLLKLVSRYSEVIKEAKIILEEECLPFVESNGSQDSKLRIKSRTTSTVDNNMLFTAYPEIYEALYNSGKLVAKAQDIRDLDEDIANNVISIKKSTWLEYDEKA